MLLSYGLKVVSGSYSSATSALEWQLKPFLGRNCLSSFHWDGIHVRWAQDLEPWPFLKTEDEHTRWMWSSNSSTGQWSEGSVRFALAGNQKSKTVLGLRWSQCWTWVLGMRIRQVHRLCLSQHAWIGLWSSRETFHAREARSQEHIWGKLRISTLYSGHRFASSSFVFL